jgi:carboxymethylenebutenolidase
MGVKAEWIHYGDQTGYFAVPERAAAPLPAVLVLQEVGGVNDQIMDVTRRIAMAGYAVLAPDLFAVDGVRPAPLSRERIGEAMAFMAKLPPAAMGDPAVRNAELAKLPEAERLRVAETMTQIFSSAAPGRMDGFLGSMKKAFRYLRAERPETRGQKVACVGFCMGGGLSALLACEEPELAGAAVYYGTAPAAEKVPAIRCPVIAFYGAKDQRVNAGIPAFAEAMRESGKSFEHHVYEGAGHAFFNDAAGSYEVKAARDSFARLLAFFARVLSG